MKEKFFTTQNKKIIATIGLLLAGWHVLIMGNNPLNLPAQPGIITNPLLGGFSILTVAGIVTLLTIFMLWTEY